MLGKSKLAAVAHSTPMMTTALPALPEAETVMVRLIRITVAGMAAYFEPVFRDTGLTENAFHVLCLLMGTEKGCASPSELSEMVGTSRANMTRVLDWLTQQGLTSRTIEARDGRRHVIALTEQGRQAALAAVPLVAPPLQRAFSALSPQEFHTLQVLLRKTILSFDKGS